MDINRSEFDDKSNREIYTIISGLSGVNLINFCSSSHNLKFNVCNQDFWRSVYIRDFPYEFGRLNNQNIDWKQLYMITITYDIPIYIFNPNKTVVGSIIGNSIMRSTNYKSTDRKEIIYDIDYTQIIENFIINNNDIEFDDYITILFMSEKHIESVSFMYQKSISDLYLQFITGEDVSFDGYDFNKREFVKIDRIYIIQDYIIYERLNRVIELLIERDRHINWKEDQIKLGIKNPEKYLNDHMKDVNHLIVKYIT